MEEDEKPTLRDDTLLMRKEDFEELLNGAAERGAERALARLGLRTAMQPATLASFANS